MKTTHVWDGSNIALELNNSNAVSARYIRGINLIKTAANVYFLYNAHGDVVQLTNTNGGVTKQYFYDAFGVEIGKDEDDPNPWRYCGEYWDEETGTIYLRARSYNPRTGRFLTEDPSRDGLNWYTYCANSPTLYIDYTGRSVILAALALASVILLAGCGSGDSNTSGISSTSPPSFGGGTAGRNGAGRSTTTQSPSQTPVLSQNSNIISASAFNDLTTNEERQNAIWAYLTQELCLDTLYAAAIMGNISVETGGTFASSTAQGFLTDYSFDINDSIGYGLLQWTYWSRKEGLLNFANEIGGNINDYDVQLLYMVYEGTMGGYKKAYSNFLSITDLAEATEYFCINFEQAGTPHMERRIEEAKRIFNNYVN